MVKALMAEADRPSSRLPVLMEEVREGGSSKDSAESSSRLAASRLAVPMEEVREGGGDKDSSSRLAASRLPVSMEEVREGGGGKDSDYYSPRLAASRFPVCSEGVGKGGNMDDPRDSSIRLATSRLTLSTKGVGELESREDSDPGGSSRLPVSTNGVGKRGGGLESDSDSDWDSGSDSDSDSDDSSRLAARTSRLSAFACGLFDSRSPRVAYYASAEKAGEVGSGADSAVPCRRFAAHGVSNPSYQSLSSSRPSSRQAVFTEEVGEGGGGEFSSVFCRELAISTSRISALAPGAFSDSYSPGLSSSAFPQPASDASRPTAPPPLSSIVLGRRRLHPPPPQLFLPDASVPDTAPHVVLPDPSYLLEQLQCPPHPHAAQLDLTKEAPCHCTDNSSDTAEDEDDGSNDYAYDHLEDLDKLYAFEGPMWEALTTPVMGLALEEEEEQLMLEGSTTIGADKRAMKIISDFDEALAGQVDVRVRVSPTSREVIMNLPLLFVGKEKNENGCAICKNGFAPKYQSTLLPCGHYYHVYCILQWLLRTNTCPMCRCELPSAEDE